MLFDIYSSILFAIHSDIYSDILFGILSDIYSGILSGSLSGILSGMYTGWSPAVPTVIHCDLELADEVWQCPLRSGAGEEAEEETAETTETEERMMG